MNFLAIFQSEYLKTRRSLASWLVLVGGIFTPLIIFIARMRFPHKMTNGYQAPDFWLNVWNNSWESMAMFMFPMGIIMATGLVTQLEFKNNAWKQLHTTPQRYVSIYFMKLIIILLLLAQVFIVFNGCLYFFTILPVLFLSNVSYPSGAFDIMHYTRDNAKYFLDCLPIVTLQFLLGMHFKNFLVPLGIGFLMWILSLTTLSWEYNYTLPFSYLMMDFLRNTGRNIPQNVNIHMMALMYSTFFTVIGYVVYTFKHEKG
mgnify:CR=1 FL=1